MDGCERDLAALAHAAGTPLTRRENAEGAWERVANLALWLPERFRNVTVLKPALPVAAGEEFLGRAIRQAETARLSADRELLPAPTPREAAVLSVLNDATVRVLARNACEVVIPAGQGCCGALHVHTGPREMARRLAKRNIEAFRNGPFDAVITSAAGCGSVLTEYPQLFAEEDGGFFDPAKTFAGKGHDVTESLAGIHSQGGLAALKVRATYQDPCHLGHAQRVRTAPRKLLDAVSGLELVQRGLDKANGKPKAAAVRLLERGLRGSRDSLRAQAPLST